MKCKSKRFLTAFLIGLFAIGFSISTISSVGVDCGESLIFCGVGQVVNIDQDVLTSNGIYQTTLNPLAYIFQLLFILFIISPPIMAFLLYLIWKELKKKNQLK
jgi:hypothetical protein